VFRPMSPRGCYFAEFGIAFDFLHNVFGSGPVILSPGPKWIGKLSYPEPGQGENPVGHVVLRVPPVT
jgi:hypothetical protein